MIFQNNNQNSLIFFITIQLLVWTPHFQILIFTIYVLDQGSQEFWRLHPRYAKNNNRYLIIVNSSFLHFAPPFCNAFYSVNVVGDSRHNSLDHDECVPSCLPQCSTVLYSVITFQTRKSSNSSNCEEKIETKWAGTRFHEPMI